MVVNGDEPDEILAWGREMLRNYRPDHIYNPDYGWRYVGSRQDRSPVRVAEREVRPALAAQLSEHHHERRRVRPARVLRTVHPALLRHPDLGRDPAQAMPR